MKKINVVFTIVIISVSPTLLVSCAGLSDDFGRLVTKPIGNTIDNVHPSVAKKPTRVPASVTNNSNLDEYFKKCSKQTGKSAVVEAWHRKNFSGSQVPESYLIAVARDAIQKCTFGKAGDKILDQLAYSAVSDFRQEYPQVQLD